MIGAEPKFMNSPFFVMEEDNWHLLPGAPEEVVREFNDYMNQEGLGGEKPVKKSFTEKIDALLSDN